MRNQLFEEGITRSRELTDAVAEAMEAIDDMAGGAEELARTRSALRDRAADAADAQGTAVAGETQAPHVTADTEETAQTMITRDASR